MINIEDEVAHHIKLLVIGLVFSGLGIFISVIFLFVAFFSKTYGETGNLFSWIGLFVITLPNVIERKLTFRKRSKFPMSILR